MSNPAGALYTKATTAVDVTERLVAIAPKVFSSEPVQLVVSTNVPPLRLEVSGPAEAIVSLDRVKQFIEVGRKRPHVVALEASLSSQTNPPFRITYSTEDGVLGKLAVQFPGDQNRLVRALDAIESEFNLTSYVDAVRTTSPAIDQSAIALRERSVADLQAAVNRLGEFQVDLTTKEAERRQRLQSEMDSAHQQRSAALESEYHARRAALDQKAADADTTIAAREKELQERIAKFETRESKYMRRELLKEIRSVLQEAEKMSLSRPTGKKRWWVHAAVWVLLGCSGSLGAFMAKRLVEAGQVDWHLLAPLTASFVTFVCTTIYYLKWNDRWFREHADGEFAAKRYKADILRASWIAELVQEWAKEGKGDLPPELIEAYTRNLFRDIAPSRVSEHPIDDVTSMLKRATELSIGKGVFTVKSLGRRKRTSDLDGD